MTKRRIFIDLDDVTADLLTGFAALCNAHFGLNLTRNSFKEWDLSKVASHVAPGDIFELLNTPGLFANLEPIPGAVESIHQLMEDPRFDVLFLSSSFSRYSCSEKRAWVRKHFGTKGAEHLILATRKDVIGRERDLLIDDQPKNVQEWAGGTMLFDAPHNQTFYHPRRVMNWDEILARLEVNQPMKGRKADLIVLDELKEFNEPGFFPSIGWDANGSEV